MQLWRFRQKEFEGGVSFEVVNPALGIHVAKYIP